MIKLYSSFPVWLYRRPTLSIEEIAETRPHNLRPQIHDPPTWLHVGRAYCGTLVNTVAAPDAIFRVNDIEELRRISDAYMLRTSQNGRA